ncbi:hypothetical protein Ancab_026094 [Ancistrocladus abbreviatus]
MDQVPGSLGTPASLALRLAQMVFSAASLFFMCLQIDFYNYTAFCFLVTVMGLIVPWSMTLGLVDTYCVFVDCPTRLPGIVTIVIMGDWVLSYLSLGASCATASAAPYLLSASSPPHCPLMLCSRYPFSAAMALLTWFMLFASTLLNIWLLPKL